MLEIIGEIGEAKPPEVTLEVSSRFYYSIY